MASVVVSAFHLASVVHKQNNVQKLCSGIINKNRYKRRVFGRLKYSKSNRESDGASDMEGFLGNLSLEYDSVWDTKPSWCQPWTITLTGVLVIGCSWQILHSIVVSALMSFLICTWWYIFLYSYPKAYKDMIAERRKNVTSGVEDIYGMKRND